MHSVSLSHITQFSFMVYVPHSIHRKSLQPLLFNRSVLKSEGEISSGLKAAEQRVLGEDEELQEIKEKYLQKRPSRKRHRAGNRKAKIVSP